MLQEWGRGQLTQENNGRRQGGRQCGLCSLVARAFRRAVCGASSRRGSGDSYQELTAPPQDEDNTVSKTILCVVMYCKTLENRFGGV